ncbi:MAG TPA: 50S ribosomal protein L18 [Bacteroidota bacterium]|jgi:large subunit ribosomal protein L18|nr:50S ribosomal protein L18 [Bacteroidota bacterium]
MIKKSRIDQRMHVKSRVRKKILGTAERPRLTVYRSLNHFYAQIVDDTQAKTLVAASSLTKELKDQLKGLKGHREIAKRVGAYLAKKATAQNVKKVVFDRNGYMFHGVVKSLADGAREGGLEF